MKRATELPPKPAIMATNAMRSRGPGFPARRLPRVPLKAQAPILHAKVPIGKLGRQALNFIILHLARTPKGENSKLRAKRRSSGS
eukprot:CAMPEP_0178787368 /NCGR_PEP_ID=MMETSP0745-20121128/5815_1 /TAXON_ID=913974 /ORGANISM="Nitzschia punctata, Strain CCMP561" /LENGTH=84 /DNA_ID=CAMNT_0020445209 /DNA_START=139 /DNA_END=393 /DNA_ORIENTATION=+